MLLGIRFDSERLCVYSYQLGLLWSSVLWFYALLTSVHCLLCYLALSPEIHCPMENFSEFGDISYFWSPIFIFTLVYKPFV